MRRHFGRAEPGLEPVIAPRACAALALFAACVAGCAGHAAAPPSTPARVTPASRRPPASDATSPAPATSPREAALACPPSGRATRDDSLVLAFAGDVIAHEAVGHAAHHERAGYAAMLAPAGAVFRDADLAFVNLESPITTARVRRGPLTFRGEESLVDALVDAGVGVVSLANNHAYDQGPRGLADTMTTVARRGLLAVGAGETRRAACAARSIEINGFRIAFLAQTLLMNVQEPLGSPDVCMWDLGALKRAVREARKRADVVVVSMHWGNEYEGAPRKEQVDVARMVVDAGADLLIGHHPHVLQRVERMAHGDRQALVAYSLGNLLSNQAYAFDPSSPAESAGDPRDVAVLRVTFTREAATAGPRLARVDAVPFWTEHAGDTITLAPATTRRSRIASRLGIPVEDAAPAPSNCRDAPAVAVEDAAGTR